MNHCTWQSYTSAQSTIISLQCFPYYPLKRGLLLRAGIAFLATVTQHATTRVIHQLFKTYQLWKPLRSRTTTKTTLALMSEIRSASMLKISLARWAVRKTCTSSRSMIHLKKMQSRMRTSMDTLACSQAAREVTACGILIGPPLLHSYTSVKLSPHQSFLSTSATSTMSISHQLLWAGIQLITSITWLFSICQCPLSPRMAMSIARECRSSTTNGAPYSHLRRHRRPSRSPSLTLNSISTMYRCRGTSLISKSDPSLRLSSGQVMLNAWITNAHSERTVRQHRKTWITSFKRRRRGSWSSS